MRPTTLVEEELAERFHRVPLDEPEPCLDCGKPARGGLYLAGEVRPLCVYSHTLLTHTAHGTRLDASLRALNALRHKPNREKARLFQANAARQLADWLELRHADRRNGARTAEATQ